MKKIVGFGVSTNMRGTTRTEAGLRRDPHGILYAREAIGPKGVFTLRIRSWLTYNGPMVVPAGTAPAHMHIFLPRPYSGFTFTYSRLEELVFGRREQLVVTGMHS
jgi:hypothetical protein